MVSAQCNVQMIYHMLEIYIILFTNVTSGNLIKLRKKRKVSRSVTNFIIHEEAWKGEPHSRAFG